MASVDFKNLPNFKALAEKAVNHGLTMAAIELSGRMKAGMSRGSRYSSSAPGSPPNVQRGRFRNSITHTPGVNLRAAAGTNLRYGYTQEKGGVIRARHSKYLPIPINAAAQRQQDKFGSSTSYFGGGFIRQGGLRQLKLDFIPGRRGRAPMLVGKRAVKVKWSVGGGGFLGFNGVPVWILKRSIKLPPRPWARPAMEKNKPALLAAFKVGMRIGFGRAAGVRVT